MKSSKDITVPGYLRSFGRRQAKKLSPARERLMNSLLPKIAVKTDTPIRDQFPSNIRELWLEIGFGGGEHLSTQARQNPDVGIVGCEPFIDGVAKLLAQIHEADVQNVRVHGDDARETFSCIGEGDLDRVFVLFPDPWRKSRHHKRRFIQTQVLDQFAKMLKDGGEFRFASDHMDYVRWTLAHVMRHPDFEWLAESPEDWRVPPTDWVRTRYEEKALGKGDACVYLRFRRKNRG
ncbi:MAG: tRNA (guanosine(46)-N7)-methyltransferase TrmB [Rhodospirillaceae bacterium]|nr:MAG: tRNA (guanosine(46)-N7)-methyltransferase TrmB [Rhodospirillaceae bacterium]